MTIRIELLSAIEQLRELREAASPSASPTLASHELGTTDVHAAADYAQTDANETVTGAWRFADTITLPKTSGKGIKLDTASPTFGWADIIGSVTPKATGVGSPARAVYNGGTLGDYAFAINDVCDFVFHIPHDYVPGTDIYFHVHWSHTDAVSITGDATFTIYHSYSKGHNQANMSAEKNFAITHATTDLTTTPQYRHRVDEAAMSTSGGSASLLDTSALEVDGVIIATLKLTALPTFGGAGKLFIHTCDIHYQTTGIKGTKARAPGFYT